MSRSLFPKIFKHRPFWLVLVAVAFAVAQIAIEGSFTFASGKLNLILLAIAVLANIVTIESLLAFAIISGVLLDLYSGLPFGLIMFSLLLAVVGVEAIFLNFLTNFSFYSLISLGLAAVLFYNLAFAGATGLIYLSGLSDFALSIDLLWRFLWQLLFAAVLMIPVYWQINRSSKWFKPMFIK